jgi:hypothetical protein
VAILAGVHDARAGRTLYFWSIFTHRERRRDIVRDGWKDVGKVFIIAVVIDCIYQVIVFRWLYPAQALIVAVILAILPYLIAGSFSFRRGGCTTGPKQVKGCCSTWGPACLARPA